MLWRYAKKSVALRIRYLVTLPKGADSNTVLVQDIPGVAFGTQAARAKTLAPAFIADKVCRSWWHRLPPCDPALAGASQHDCLTCSPTICTSEQEAVIMVNRDFSFLFECVVMACRGVNVGRV